MADKKKVAVIGAGPSGLVSTKSILSEGHYVTCFEMGPTIGGLWNYETYKTDLGYQVLEGDDQPVQAVYKTLVQNTSKVVNAFSDFPYMHTEHPFATHWEYRNYLEQYATHFKLQEHIKLKSWVTRLVKDKKQWIVQYTNATHEEGEENFDFVIIATGTFKFPYIPSFSGLTDSYKGVVLHTSQVRDEGIFKGKRILVIGGGNSGMEIAVGALRNQVAKVYFNCTSKPNRRNYWVINRLYPDADGTPVPYDYSITRSFYLEDKEAFKAHLETWLALVHAKGEKDAEFSPGDSVSATERDIFLASKASHQLEKVGLIDSFERHDVILKDGNRLKDIDYVVMGTGYRGRYPFLDTIWRPEDQVKSELYKYMLHPDVEMDGLAFILSIPVFLSAFVTMEMQARWLLQKLIPRHYDESGSLFSAIERQTMLEDLKQTYSYKNDVPFILEDNYEYVEALSKEIGCMPPSYEELQKCGDKEKLLAVAVRYGPFMGTHYRLQGPGKWEGAKDWIIEVCKKVLGPKRMEEYMKSM